MRTNTNPQYKEVQKCHISTDAHTISVFSLLVTHVQNSSATPAGLNPYFIMNNFPRIKALKAHVLPLSSLGLRPHTHTHTHTHSFLSLWARFMLHTNRIYIMHHHNYLQGGDLDTAFRLQLISLGHCSFLLVFQNLILLANHNSSLFLEDPSYHIYKVWNYIFNITVSKSILFLHASCHLGPYILLLLITAVSLPLLLLHATLPEILIRAIRILR